MQEGIRLDSRKLNESRPIEVFITRGEMNCVAEGILGESDKQQQCTRVICVVEGKVVSPYVDRTTEGIFTINTDLSGYADQSGVSNSELRRLLERSIRESDAIDMESLCIVVGEKVWHITCDVQVLDFHGGNLIECAMYVTMAALRAFRKPDVAVTSIASMNEKHGKTRTNVQIFSSMERDPLPLALHHTPLAATIGIIKLPIPNPDVSEFHDSFDDIISVTIII